MAINYTRAVALANRLISANGRSVTVQQLSAVAADPTKPWLGTGTPTVSATSVVSAVFVPLSSAQDLGKSLVDEALLKDAEQVLLVAANGTDLTTFHMILDGSVRWKITGVRELKPGPTVILYAFGVAR